MSQSYRDPVSDNQNGNLIRERSGSETPDLNMPTKRQDDSFVDADAFTSVHDIPLPRSA